MIKLDEQRLPMTKAEAPDLRNILILEAHLWVVVKNVQLKQSLKKQEAICTEEMRIEMAGAAGIKCPGTESNSAPDSLPTFIPAQQMGKNNGLLFLQRPVIIN